MHHKRGKARNARAGCKLCKVNGFRTERLEGEKFSDHRRRASATADASMTDWASATIRNETPEQVAN